MSQKKIRIRLAIAAWVGAAFVELFGTPSAALAQTCSVSAVSGSYGAVDVLPGTVTDATSSLTVTCSGKKNKKILVCVDIGVGVNAGGSLNQRSLVKGANGLLHELYADPNRGQIWGSWNDNGATPYPSTGGAGVMLDLTLDHSGSVTSPPQTIYARIFGNQQTTIPGTYIWTSPTPSIAYTYRTGVASCPLSGSFQTANASRWTANVQPNCLVTAADLDYGSHGFLGNAVDMTSAINVRCTNTTPYKVGLSGGLSAATDPTQRKMSKGAETVTYGLYSDPNRKQPWGDTTGTVQGTGTGLKQPLTVYGRAPAQRTPSPGVYSDTINVIVTY